MCKIDECSGKVKARGLCDKHLGRYYRHGDASIASVRKPANTQCAVDGCARKPSGKYCGTHRSRLLRTGVLHLPETLEEKFWDRVGKTETCWLWTMKLTDKGYGTIISSECPEKYAHRVSWYLLVDKNVPAELDHQCLVRHCVNPHHLKPTTHKENMENQGLSSNNTSGYRGVTLHKPSGKWQANVRHNGKLHYLGRFEDIEDANLACIQKRSELFTNNVSDKYIMDS